MFKRVTLFAALTIQFQNAFGTYYARKVDPRILEIMFWKQWYGTGDTPEPAVIIEAIKTGKKSFFEDHVTKINEIIGSILNSNSDFTSQRDIFQSWNNLKTTVDLPGGPSVYEGYLPARQKMAVMLAGIDKSFRIIIKEHVLFIKIKNEFIRNEENRWLLAVPSYSPNHPQVLLGYYLLKYYRKLEDLPHGLEDATMIRAFANYETKSIYYAAKNFSEKYLEAATSNGYYQIVKFGMRGRQKEIQRNVQSSLENDENQNENNEKIQPDVNYLMKIYGGAEEAESSSGSCPPKVGETLRKMDHRRNSRPSNKNEVNKPGKGSISRIVKHLKSGNSPMKGGGNTSERDIQRDSSARISGSSLMKEGETSERDIQTDSSARISWSSLMKEGETSERDIQTDSSARISGKSPMKDVEETTERAFQNDTSAKSSGNSPVKRDHKESYEKKTGTSPVKGCDETSERSGSSSPIKKSKKTDT